MPKPELKDRYDRDGFLINATDLLPEGVVRRAAEGMAAVRRGEYDTGKPPESSPWKPGDSDNVLCKIEQPQLASSAIGELIRHPLLGEWAAAATGAKRVQVWWVQLLHKPPTPVNVKSGTNVGWHQDRAYWGAWTPQSELFTLWVALSDVTAQSGPMAFVPGSHRWGLQAASDFYAQDLQALKAKVNIPAGERWEEITAILPPGGFTIHDDLTWHGSGPNHTSSPRKSFAIHLRTDKSEPIGGKREGLTKFIDDPSVCPWIYP
jgi:hypothetical protein